MHVAVLSQIEGTDTVRKITVILPGVVDGEPIAVKPRHVRTAVFFIGADFS